MKKTLYLSLLVLLLSACGPSPEQQAALTATAQTATAAAWTPTPTVTLTPTATQTPTPTLTLTPSVTPTQTDTPAPTQDPNRYYAYDGTFSLEPPAGWKAIDLGLKNLALISDAKDGSTQNLVFIPEESAFPMAFYSATVQDSIQQTYVDVTSITEEFKVTSSGLEYFYWVIENTQQGMKLRQALFIFENGDLKLTVIYTRIAGEAPEADALIDQSIDTFRFEQ